MGALLGPSFFPRFGKGEEEQVGGMGQEAARSAHMMRIFLNLRPKRKRDNFWFLGRNCIWIENIRRFCSLHQQSILDPLHEGQQDSRLRGRGGNRERGEGEKVLDSSLVGRGNGRARGEP